MEKEGDQEEDAEEVPQKPNIPDEYYPIWEAEPIDLGNCRYSHKSIKLQGPKSPLETEVYSANSGNRLRNIHIDGNSVNSVLLSAPEDVWILTVFQPIFIHFAQKKYHD